jgi:type II secretory pathway pseudopilin PulG
MTRRNLNREDGWVLVSAIVLMAIMLSVGLSAFAFVDTGQKRSRESRERESALSLAEAALYAQGFGLAKNWPNASKQLSGDCSSAAALTATTLYCPDRNTLAKGSSADPNVAQFADVDFGADSTWSTSVRDNSGVLAAAYDPALADNTLVDPVKGECPQTPCRMDWNGDRQLWVQAKATVRGRPRNIVARLKLELLRESVPQAGVVTGSLDITNNGNKLMLDGTGSSVVVRCAPLTSSSCMSYDAGKGQLTPPPSSAPGQPNFMTPAQLERFKQRAITDGTYFPAGTCPANAAELTGAVVWVERCDQEYAHIGPYSTPCAVPSSIAPNCINPTTVPGMLIWHCGTLGLTANHSFYGIVYMVNNSDGTCSGWTAKDGACGAGTIYTSSGGGAVLGALVVDGNACIEVGSNSLNMKFDANVFNGVTSYGTVGLVQNTWRELKAGS